MKEQTLVDLGLSEREAKAYISLLKLGEATALELSKVTGEQRTNTYDTLESLHKKAIVSFIIKNNRRIYVPNKPENLLDFFKEKERNLLEILPQLKDLHSPKKERPVVEVYEGVEGMKTVLNQSIIEAIKSKKELIAFGAQQQKTREIAQNFIKDIMIGKRSLK